MGSDRKTRPMNWLGQKKRKGTEDALRESEEKTRDLGIRAFMPKPFFRKALAQAGRDALDRR